MFRTIGGSMYCTSAHLQTPFVDAIHPSFCAETNTARCDFAVEEAKPAAVIMPVAILPWHESCYIVDHELQYMSLCRRDFKIFAMTSNAIMFYGRYEKPFNINRKCADHTLKRDERRYSGCGLNEFLVVMDKKLESAASLVPDCQPSYKRFQNRLEVLPMITNLKSSRTARRARSKEK